MASAAGPHLCGLRSRAAPRRDQSDGARPRFCCQQEAVLGGSAWGGTGGTLPTGRAPQPGLMNLCASVQPFRPGFLLPRFLRCKLLLQPWQSLPSLLIPLPMLGCSGATGGVPSRLGSSPSPNPHCFSFVAHPHLFGTYQLPGPAVLSPLVLCSGSAAEAAGARSHPRAAPPCPWGPHHPQEAFAAGSFTP